MSITITRPVIFTLFLFLSGAMCTLLMAAVLSLLFDWDKTPKTKAVMIAFAAFFVFVGLGLLLLCGVLYITRPLANLALLAPPYMS